MDTALTPTILLSQLEPLLLGLARIGAAMMTLPLLPAKVFPRQIRMAKAIALSLAVYPMMSEQLPDGQLAVGYWTILILKELFIGGVIGYLMGTLLWAFSSAGEIIDTQIGFELGQIFDPMSDRPQGPVGSFYGQLGVLLFVALGGLHVFLALLYESLAIWPPASFFPVLSAELFDISLAAGASVLEHGARLFLPVFGLLLLVELGIGMLNRISPQFETFYFSLPIKAILAVLLIALTMAHMVDLYRDELGERSDLIEGLDSSMDP
jgi:type III secretion protein T